MKNILKSFLLLLVLTNTSCSDTSENGRSILVGDWEVMESSVSFVDGVEALNDDITFTVSFFDDGTGKKVWNFFPNEVDFEWVYQDDPNVISIYENATTLGGTAIIPSSSKLFEIVESDSENQFWRGSRNDYITLDTLAFGLIETEWRLTPK